MSSVFCFCHTSHDLLGGVKLLGGVAQEFLLFLSLLRDTFSHLCVCVTVNVIGDKWIPAVASPLCHSCYLPALGGGGGGGVSRGSGMQQEM